MEVDTSKSPAEGEVTIFTTGGGGFVVSGSMRDILAKIKAEEWPDFELAESGDHIVLCAAQVIALRGGTRRARGSIGFVHRD